MKYGLFKIIDFKNLDKPDEELTTRTRLFTGYGCNINCRFCFYKGKKHIDIKDRIYEQLHEGKRYGIKDWDISGGEPTLLPYWFDLLKDMNEMGFDSIACITNGYELSDINFMKQSIRSGLNEVLFSIHGKNAESHDRLTGIEGSFKKVIKALKNAYYLGLTIRINVVVTKDNCTELPEIAELVVPFYPVSINFLPFRVENTANQENMIKYSEITPYIKETIDLWGTHVVMRVRYMPFCLMKDFEHYCCGYLQRLFDPYEWSEYCIRKFEFARKNKPIQPVNVDVDKWKLEIGAVNQTLKTVAGHKASCLKCKYLYICDGIWYTYAKEFGTDEFNPIKGEKIKCITLN